MTTDSIEPAIKNAVLSAIRDGKYPCRLLEGFSGRKEDMVKGVLTLHRQGFIVVRQLGTKETGRGSTFVLQSADPDEMPRQAELTLKGERYVDQQRGINSAFLEEQGRIALLKCLQPEPVENFDRVQMPEGIGPRRKAFLVQDTLNKGLARPVTTQAQQGFFSISRPAYEITPKGAKEYAKTTNEDISQDFRAVMRQVLLNLVEQEQQLVMDAFRQVQTIVLDAG